MNNTIDCNTTNYSYSFRIGSTEISTIHNKSLRNSSFGKSNHDKQYHRIYLKTKLRNNPKYKPILNHTLSPIKTNTDDNDLFLTETPIKIGYNKKPSINFIPPKRSFMSLYSFRSPKCNNNRNRMNTDYNSQMGLYINTIKLARKAQMVKMIQTEQYKQIKENESYLHQQSISKVNKTIETYKMFKQFLFNMHLYVKFLNEQITLNTNKLNNIRCRKNELDIEVKQLNFKITKLRNQLAINKTIKTFLLCVKYKTRHIDETKYNNNKQIFKSTEDFLNTLYEIESSVLEKFISENVLNNELESTKETKKNLIMSYKQYNKRNEIKDKQTLTKVLYLKNKYSQLKKQCNVLKQEQINQKNNNDMLEEKLKDFFMALPYNIEKKFNVSNLYSSIKKNVNMFAIRKEKHNIILFYLSVLEKIVFYHFEHFKKINSDLKTKIDILKIKMFLDLQKRLNNSRIKVQLEKKRKENVNLNIISKNNSVLYKPNKRALHMFYKTKFKTKNCKNKSSDKNKTYSLEMITY